MKYYYFVVFEFVEVLLFEKMKVFVYMLVLVKKMMIVEKMIQLFLKYFEMYLILVMALIQ